MEEKVTGPEVQTIEEKEAQLDQKEAELKEREQKLSILEAAVTGAKYNLYDRIKVSVRTMDIFIAVVAVALVVAIIAAVITRG